MTPVDKSKFYKFIQDIFLDEWSEKKLSADQLERWFKALQFENLDRIKKAFGEYLRDPRIGRFAPKEGQILDIVRIIPFDTASVRCTWQGCSERAVDVINDYHYCRLHYDEMILKTDPDSTYAKIVLDARIFEEGRKELGISGQEYFKRIDPKLFDSIQKMRVENKVDSTERKIIRALGDFYETDIPKEEKDRILGKMKGMARYYKLKDEDKAKC